MAARRRRIVWTHQARSALDEIVAYIAESSIQSAQAILEEALGAAEGLATFSERGRIVPELDESSVREVFVANYRLLYEVTTTEVRILGILHGARDFMTWRQGL